MNKLNEKQLESLVVSLCRECHQGIHNKLGYDYNTLFHINS